MTLDNDPITGFKIGYYLYHTVALAAEDHGPQMCNLTFHDKDQSMVC